MILFLNFIPHQKYKSVLDSYFFISMDWIISFCSSCPGLRPLFLSCRSKVFWWRLRGSFLIVLMSSPSKFTFRRSARNPDLASPAVASNIKREGDTEKRIELDTFYWSNCITCYLILKYLHNYLCYFEIFV